MIYSGYCDNEMWCFVTPIILYVVFCNCDNAVCYVDNGDEGEFKFCFLYWCVYTYDVFQILIVHLILLWNVMWNHLLLRLVMFCSYCRYVSLVIC